MKKYLLVFTGVILFAPYMGWGNQSNQVIGKEGARTDGALRERAFENSPSLAEARRLTKIAHDLMEHVQEFEKDPKSFSREGKPLKFLKVARQQANTARKRAKLANQYAQTLSSASVIYCRYGFM